MSPSGEQLLKDALRLPEDERATLVIELLSSLEPTPSQPRSEREWLAEVERRARAALAGKTGLTWDEAVTRVTDRLARR
jgi:putative addiction module component (TIGR02574 family)